MKPNIYQAILLTPIFIMAVGCGRQPSSVESTAPVPAVTGSARSRSAGPSVRSGAAADGYAARRDSGSEEVTDRSGPVESQPSRKGRSKLRSAEIIGGTAAVGAAIGALAGGGKGAAIGAIAGGGGGLVYDRATAHKNNNK